MRVGFIGLGMMGKNAAANIRRKGFDMVVYDIRPEATAPLMAMGAERGESPADVMVLCDVVVTMVFGPKEVEAVVPGPQGFFDGRLPG